MSHRGDAGTQSKSECLRPCVSAVKTTDQFSFLTGIGFDDITSVGEASAPAPDVSPGVAGVDARSTAVSCPVDDTRIN